VKLPLRLTGSFDAARVTLAPFLDLQIIGVADPKQRGAAAGVRVPGFDISRDCVSRLTVKSLAARRRVRARARAARSAKNRHAIQLARGNVIWPRGVSPPPPPPPPPRCIQARRWLRMRSSCSFFGSLIEMRSAIEIMARPSCRAGARSCKLLRSTFCTQRAEDKRHRSSAADLPNKPKREQGRHGDIVSFHAR